MSLYELRHTSKFLFEDITTVGLSFLYFVLEPLVDLREFGHKSIKASVHLCSTKLNAERKV